MHNSADALSTKECNKTSGLKPKPPPSVRQMSLLPQHLEATWKCAPYRAPAQRSLLKLNSVFSD